MREKPVEWMGDSRKDLRDFPAEARGEAGYDLFAARDLETARERYLEMLDLRGKGK